MNLKITDDGRRIRLEIQSDGQGNYIISSDRGLPRKDGRVEYMTSDGLHVACLIQLVFGASDSSEYLKRRLAEHNQEATRPSEDFLNQEESQ